VDPRNYQIAALSGFVVFGTVVLDFQISMTIALAILISALACQWLLFAPGQLKSALISSLSLVLLLRTDVIFVAVLASVIAIAGKRYLRINGNHFFNPSALALVLLCATTSHAWLSPGQWGALGLAGLLVIGAGLLVVTRAQRLDIACAFLISFSLIVLARGVYLGDPVSIAYHQLQNGALILFAFFMITDPKTTPLNQRARIAFGVLVAVVTAVLQFGFYLNAAPIYALVFLAPTVVIFNLLVKENRYVKKSIVNRVSVRRTCVGQRHGLLRFLRS